MPSERQRSSLPDGVQRHVVMDSRVLIRQVKLADQLQACLQVSSALQGQVSQQLQRCQAAALAAAAGHQG